MLERRYQRLLFVYPRAYRRSRGEEMVGLLMDAAPPGRTRPTVREAANLVRHGLRARLGRPASRTIMVWATLTAVICGLFTAAVATRLAWETGRPMPDHVETQAILSQIAPEHRFDAIRVSPALFTWYDQQVRLRDLKQILLFEGGEYHQSSSGAGATGSPPMPAAAALANAQTRMRAAGWHVYPPSTESYPGCGDKTCSSSVTISRVTVPARRGDTDLRLSITEPIVESDQPYLSVSLSRVPPPAVIPAGIGGGLLGAALSWLVFGWASRRSEKRVGPSLCLTATLVLWWLPTALGAVVTLLQHRHERHRTWPPLWEWLGQPFLSLFFVVGLATALLGLALAAPRPEQATPAIPKIG